MQKLIFLHAEKKQSFYAEGFTPKKSREKAKETGCRNNLKQIGTGFCSYITDYDYMPKRGAGGDDPYWQHQIAPYMGWKAIPSATYVLVFDTKVDYPILRCPSDTTPLYTAHRIAGKGGISYGYNVDVGGATLLPPKTYGCKATKMRDPSNTYMLLDSPGVGVTYNNATQIKLRHGNSKAVNMLWGDFHVSSVKYPLTTDVGGAGLYRYWTPAKD